jgi:hypothetical protein
MMFARAQLETKQIAAENLNDFLSWIHQEQRLDREARGSTKDWSMMRARPHMLSHKRT